MASPPSVSTSRIFAVPQLDEDSLKTLPNHGAPHLNGKSADEGNGSPANSRGFTLVADGIPGFGSAAAHGGVGSNPPSPTPGSVDMSELAFLQQQQQAAAVAAAAAQIERDYYYTRMMLQQSPRPVLLAVLTSLMDDFPTTLISPIKSRLEQCISASSGLKGGPMALSTLAAAAAAGASMPSSSPMSAAPSPSAQANAGRRTSAMSFVPNTNAAPWTPSSQQQPQQGGVSVPSTPYSNSHSHSPNHSRGNNSGSTTKGKGKGAKEEQSMCSIHHSKRAMKHLQRNPETGLYECIHGFHCLVDEPVPAKRDAASSLTASPDRKTTPGNASGISQDATNGHSSGFTVVGTDKNDGGAALEGSDSCIGGRARNGSGVGAALKAPAAGRFFDPTSVGGYASGLQRGSGSGSSLPGVRGEGSSPADDELLAYTLQLLQSVRDIEEEEE